MSDRNAIRADLNLDVAVLEWRETAVSLRFGAPTRHSNTVESFASPTAGWTTSARPNR